MKTIDDLLIDIKEDKDDNLVTTSFLFKRNLWDFFEGFQNKNCVEFGTHKGQTTRILAHRFNKVYTINLPGKFDSAKELNADLTNIEYVPMDLYSQPVNENFEHLPISMVFIDAEHIYESVLMDVKRGMNFNLDVDDVYFVFDDYGAYLEVWNAVQYLITNKTLSFVQYIGHSPEHIFGKRQNTKLITDYEGIICKLNK